MSQTKLSLTGNYEIIPGQEEGTGKTINFFYSVYLVIMSGQSDTKGVQASPPPQKKIQKKIQCFVVVDVLF